MLQERSKFASAISEVYMFSAEMLRVMSNKDPFQVCIDVDSHFFPLFSLLHDSKN